MKRILAVVAAGVLVAAVIGFGPAFACDKAKAEGAAVAKADAKEGCPMAKGQDGAKSDGAGCPKAAATVANANGAAAAKPCGAAPAAVAEGQGCAKKSKAINVAADPAEAETEIAEAKKK